MYRVIKNLELDNLISSNISTTNSTINNLNYNVLNMDTIKPATASGDLYLRKNGGTNIAAHVNMGVNITGSAATYALNVSGGTATFLNIQPVANNTYDLGSPTASWLNLYASGSMYKKSLLGYQGTGQTVSAGGNIYVDFTTFSYNVNDGFTISSIAGAPTKYYIQPPADGRYLITYKHICGNVSAVGTLEIYMSDNSNPGVFETGAYFYSSTTNTCCSLENVMDLTSSSQLCIELTSSIYTSTNEGAPTGGYPSIISVGKID